MKRISLVITIVLVLGVFTGCGGKSSSFRQKTAQKSTAESFQTKNSIDPAGRLVLYSPANDEEYYMVVDAFCAKYPKIQIETVQGGSGELKTRLASEKSNPKADVMFGGLSYADAVTYKDLWKTYVSPNDTLLPPAFRNTTGFVTLKSVNLQVLLVNKVLESKTGVSINGLEDLLNPALKGKISMPDPGSSSTAYRWLTCILYVMGDGDPESEAAWNYVEALIKNLDGKIASSTSVAHKSVYQGEYVVGLTSESNGSSYLSDGFGNIVRVVYPVEGTTAPSYGVAMIKNCRNPSNAELFIDFLISDEGQDIYARSSFRPANFKHVNTSEYLPNIVNIKIVDEDYAYISAKQEQILDRFNDLWSKYN